MKPERDFLVKALQTAGVRGKIHDSLKSLKNCNEVHVGAVLRVNEKFTRSGSKKRYQDQEGQRKQRNKLFNRITKLHVVIADSEESKVEAVLTKFLQEISKGFAVDGNWVGIELENADWVEQSDSILKSKIAVEFDVILTGGVYKDVNLVNAEIGKINANHELHAGIYQDKEG